MNIALQGWITVAAIILAAGLAGDPAHAQPRTVVCVPVVDPAPLEPVEGEGTPVVYTF